MLKAGFSKLKQTYFFIASDKPKPITTPDSDPVVCAEEIWNKEK
ncbi:hypothetical protein [uncultured Mucilaginibacter sp.]|nr:hypothetical protein [uncultured Mucilaginibacter sp.]